MPRFAANLKWLFTEHDFLDRFGRASAAGFRAVEFPSPYEHSPAELAARLDQHGLECVLFNLPSGDVAKGDFGIACRPERRAEFRAGVARALDYAAVLGNTRLTCIAGKAAEGEDRATLERTLVENLRYAARELRQAGVELLVEPINSHDVPGFLVPRSPQVAAIIERVDDDNVGLQCDLYHTAMMGDDPQAMLAGLMPVIRHIQFADAPGRGEPGQGRLDFPGLFAAIDASGYPGWISAEYRPSKRTEDTLHWRDSAA